MINLEKKQKIDLTKKDPGLKLVRIGLSWDEIQLNGQSPDADASLFMLNENSKLPSDDCFIFYNNLVSPDSSVKHNGDNRTGAGEGDDETIDIDLTKVDSGVVQLLFAVTIHNSDKGFNFGNTKNASVRVYNNAKNQAICQYQLAEEFPDCDSLILGRLFRNGSEWEFEAMGSAFSGGLEACLEMYN